ncbi:MAG: amylo-alpha-1,6-glucosidase [Candidatus Hodarchaeota archaeon]
MYVFSNGLIWIYIKKETTEVFSLGNWLFTYQIQPSKQVIKVTDHGNKGIILYEGNLERKIIIQGRTLTDICSELNYKIIPRFKTNLHWRGWEIPPEPPIPIETRPDKFMGRKGFNYAKFSYNSQGLTITLESDISYIPEADEWFQARPSVITKDPSWKKLFEKSLRALYKLRLLSPLGEVKAAGFPLFPSIFGRDFCLSALGEIYVDPNGVLNELNVHLRLLGKKRSLPSAEEPGKAIHEYPFDGMTERGLQNFPNWFGADESPLLIQTLFRTARITAQPHLILENQLALAKLWTHTLHQDLDGDGLIEYQRHSSQFVIHQTWRDGGNQIIHATGEEVQQPIATLWEQLCLFAALKEVSLFQKTFPELERSLEPLYITLDWTKSAIHKKLGVIKDRLNLYWMPEKDAYALALDASKELVAVANSDICLGFFYEAFPKAKAQLTYENVLLDPTRLKDSAGIRTISKEHTKIYDPKSYQKGACWPWQLGLLIAGLQNYDLDPLPFISSLLNLTGSGSLAEVYISDQETPKNLPTCIEQRWSAALPWFALLEGLLRLKIFEQPSFSPLKLPLPTMIFTNLYWLDDTHNLKIDFQNAEMSFQ